MCIVMGRLKDVHVNILTLFSYGWYFDCVITVGSDVENVFSLQDKYVFYKILLAVSFA